MFFQMGKSDAQQVGCCLHPADQKQDRHVQQFAAGQMLAIDLSLNEAADQIGAWIGRTLVIDLLKVSADGFGASLDLCKAVDTIGGAVARSETLVNPEIEIHPDRKSTRLNSSH